MVFLCGCGVPLGDGNGTWGCSQKNVWVCGMYPEEVCSLEGEPWRISSCMTIYPEKFQGLGASLLLLRSRIGGGGATPLKNSYVSGGSTA